MKPWLSIALLVTAELATVGCGPVASATPIVTDEVAETPTPEDLEAIRFRTTFGLRSDLAYIRAVAGDPRASSMEFAVPLLPAELAELNARAANAEAIRDTIRAYTRAHPDEFAGLYLDQENGGGGVTTMWTGHLDEHAAAIRALVHPGARVAFRGAVFTERELRELQDRVSADWDWMREFDIAPSSVGVDVVRNRVEIVVSSADPGAPQIVRSHYGAEAPKILVISDGTGAALIGNGTVRGRAVDAEGNPPGERLAGELVLQWTSDGPGDCGFMDVGFGLNADGTFELPCQAGGHTIMVQIGIPDDGWRTIASAHVVVVADAVASVEIRLEGPWPAPTAP